MKFKQWIPALALLTGVMFLTPGAAAAAEYEFIEGQNMLRTYQGEGGDVQVPSEVDGIAVEILNGTFSSLDNVTGIEIPEGVKVLGSASVHVLPNLTSVTLPEGLQVIDNYNFWECDALTELTIPASVVYIGRESLVDCDRLEKITFTGEVPVLAEGILTYMPDSLVVYVPEDLLQEYREALPEGVQVESSGQPSVAVDQTAPEEDFAFDAATGTITAYKGNACCLIIPETIGGTAVQAIGDNATAREAGRTYFIEIPEGVEQIGNHAFDSLRNLVGVKFPASLRGIGDYAFRFYRGYDVSLNEGLETIGTGAFDSASLYGELHLPEGLKTVGDEAFYNCFRLEEVYFPESIESIGERAFQYTSLTYLRFEKNGLPQIASSAFEGLAIADVDLHWQTNMEQVAEAQKAFDALGQKAVVWSNNPASYGLAYEVGYNVGEARAATYVQEGEESFLESYSGTMPDVTVYTGMNELPVAGIAEGCFRENQVIRSFYPHHCGWFTTIGAEAFAGSSLEMVEMFDSITTVGDGAFRDCGNLQEIVLPASLTTVGEGVFDGCDSLRKVTVLCDPHVLPEGIFAGCGALQENPEGVILEAGGLLEEDELQRLLGSAEEEPETEAPEAETEEAETETAETEAETEEAETETAETEAETEEAETETAETEAEPEKAEAEPEAADPETEEAEPVLLQRGDRGDAVVELQTLLWQCGWIFEEPDGIFGKRTEAALKEYQEYAGFEVNGIADQTVIEQLRKDWSVLWERPYVIPGSEE